MNAVTIHRARVPRSHGTRADVERWFGAVPLDQLGLGEEELFYVPRLRLRLPPGAPTADGAIPRLLLAQLRDMLEGAVRGHGGRFVPGRAYRFAGRPDYLAWLVRLWVRDGSPGARDAFEAATGAPALAAWQRRTVLREGPALVATLARLAGTGDAARWLERFEPADHAAAAAAVQASFGLSLTEPARAPLTAASAAACGEAPPPSPAPAAPAPLAARLAVTVEALIAHGNDWRALSEQGRALLLAAVLLHRQPAAIVSDGRAIAAAVIAFAREPQAVATQAAFHSETGADAAPGAPLRTPWNREATPDPRSAGQRPPLPTAGDEEDRPEVVTSVAGPEAAAPPGAAPRPDIPLPHLPPPPFSPAASVAFDTAFGGLLFLLNAFVALGLYPDFTQPLGERLEPSPLWLIDRIGRLRFGDSYRRDALAGWIAGNAVPGRLPRLWVAQPAWIAGFGAATRPRLSRRGGRATFWHDCGFPLLDGPAAAVARRLPRRVRPSRQAPVRGSERWAACLALYLEARLQRSGAGLALLRAPARIEVRDLEVRAAFQLDAHPIALRLAGLDRDPGWQPAEGRAFAFAFR